MTDSTPLIRGLEAIAGRCRDPDRSALAFLDALLEDYADEWVTKAMFHYRWAFAPDVAKAAAILPRWSRTTSPRPGRCGGEGSPSGRSASRGRRVEPDDGARDRRELSPFARLLDAQLTEPRFVMGGRPGASDFGLFGQLSQLAGSIRLRRIAHETAPRVVAWVDVVKDLPEWSPATANGSPATRYRTPCALLAELGRVYVPFLLANAGALERGAEPVECTIDGRPWVQRPFPYQGKCLAGCAKATPPSQRTTGGGRRDSRRNGVRAAVRSMGPWRPEPHDGNASPSRPGRRSMRQILLLALTLAVPATGAGAQEVAWHVLEPSPPSAGPTAIITNIYNGTPTSDFPAVVGLAITNRDGTAGICTGTLIAPSAVLTAARCPRLR